MKKKEYCDCYMTKPIDPFDSFYKNICRDCKYEIKQPNTPEQTETLQKFIERLQKFGKENDCLQNPFTINIDAEYVSKEDGCIYGSVSVFDTSPMWGLTMSFGKPGGNLIIESKGRAIEQ